MNAVIAQLVRNGPVLTDGAWGTELQARGLPIGEFPDSWNLHHPDRVSAVAAAYVNAGSQVILTNTFGSNLFRLREAGLAHDLRELNCAGVWISRQAAGGRAAVFASMGPSGKLLLSGEITPHDLRAAFQRQADALAEAGPDAIVVETMADLEEARAAVAAAHSTGLPVVACMVFDSGKEKDRTMMGVTPERAAAGLAEAGADVIGANCGQGIATAPLVCRRLHAATQLPIWIKPNAGLPEIRDGRAVYHIGPAEFARFIPELLAAGASFVGGCCGTSPDFIREIHERKLLKQPCG